MKSSTILWVMSLLLILLAILIIPPVRGDGSDVVYATITIYVEAGYIEGSYGAYGSLKVEIPRYLLVDRENEIKVIFDRSTCLNGVQIAVSIVGKTSIASGEKEITLGGANFDFGCSASSRQVNTVKIVIPRTIYEESITKTIVIYIKDVAGYGLPFRRVTVISNIPAGAFLVLGVPVPQVSIIGLDGGALYLRTGETKSFAISITSLNAPILVSSVKMDVPVFAAAYVNTPLPLNIGINETRSIVIAIRGSSPGAGVVRVNIVYYNGVENKELTLYVPVVVDEDKIYSLIEEYNRQIQQIQSKISQLEAELGIKISDVSNLSQRLDSIIVALDNFIKQHSILLNESQTLAIKYQGLEQRIQTLENNLQALINDYQRRLQEIDNRIQNLTNEVRGSVQKVNDEISELSARVSELGRAFALLKAATIATAVVAAACAVWVVIKRAWKH